MKISEHWKLVPREASDAVLECLYEDSQEAWAYLLNTTPSEPTEAMERVVSALKDVVRCLEHDEPVGTGLEDHCREALAALEREMEGE